MSIINVIRKSNSRNCLRAWKWLRENEKGRWMNIECSSNKSHSVCRYSSVFIAIPSVLNIRSLCYTYCMINCYPIHFTLGLNGVDIRNIASFERGLKIVLMTFIRKWVGGAMKEGERGGVVASFIAY